MPGCQPLGSAPGLPGSPPLSHARLNLTCPYLTDRHWATPLPHHHPTLVAIWRLPSLLRRLVAFWRLLSHAPLATPFPTMLVAFRATSLIPLGDHYLSHARRHLATPFPTTLVAIWRLPSLLRSSPSGTPSLLLSSPFGDSCPHLGRHWATITSPTLVAIWRRSSPFGDSLTLLRSSSPFGDSCPHLTARRHWATPSLPLLRSSLPFGDSSSSTTLVAFWRLLSSPHWSPLGDHYLSHARRHLATPFPTTLVAFWRLLSLPH